MQCVQNSPGNYLRLCLRLASNPLRYGCMYVCAWNVVDFVASNDLVIRVGYSYNSYVCGCFSIFYFSSKIPATTEKQDLEGKARQNNEPAGKIRQNIN